MNGMAESYPDRAGGGGLRRFLSAARKGYRGSASLKWLLTLVFAATLFQLSPAAELRDLKMLYVGNAKLPRAAEYRAFFATNVAQITVAERVGFDPAQAKDFDVVLLDWPQSERDPGFPAVKAPLGERKEWTKPTVFLGSAGLNLAAVWDVKGGFG